MKFASHSQVKPLSLVNVGGGLNAGAAVDFKTYGEVGSPYNRGARIEAVDEVPCGVCSSPRS